MNDTDKTRIIIDIENGCDWEVTINGEKKPRATKFSIDLDVNSNEFIAYTLSEYAFSDEYWGDKRP